jgi:hypothetical protein
MAWAGMDRPLTTTPPMSTISRWLAPVRQMASAFFRHDLKLRREEGGHLHVVLAERPPATVPSKPDRAESERRRRLEEVMLVRTELAALLNELPETRSTMRHLVFVEQAIAKKGLKVLHKVPLDVLRRAHDQLDNLVINWSAAGLANLRSKMAVAIIDREHMDTDAEADAYRTAAVHDPDGDKDEREMDLASLASESATARSDDEALAAAYEVLGSLGTGAGTGFGDLAPVAVEMQGELGSASARALLRPQSRAFDPEPAEISIRVLQP